MGTDDKNDSRPIKPLDGQQSVNLLDYATALMRWRKFIVRNVLIITGLAIIVSLLLPKWYLSKATILPPKSRDLLSGLGNISSFVREFPTLRGLTGGSGASDLYNFLAILKSRTAMERVVSKFNLTEVYGVSSVENAIDALEGNVNFKVNEEGTISIEVYDNDSQRATDMANYYAEVLNDVGTKLITTEARGNRQFIEKRVNQNQLDLKKAEEELRNFQQRHGVVAVPEQTQSTISAAANLYATKMLKEIEVGILEKNVSPENSLLQQARTQLYVINAKLKDIPDLGIEYFRLYREVVIQQKILEFLIPLYEQIKFEEKRDTPTLLVLDPAKVPERPAKPRRLIIVTIFALLSLILSIATALFMENLKRLKATDEGKFAKMEQFWFEVKRIFKFNKFSFSRRSK